VQSEPTPEPEQGEQSKPTPADVSLPRPPEPVEEYVPPPEGGGVVIGLEAERPRETKSPQSFTAPAMEELPSPSHQEEPPAHPTPQPPDDAAQPAPTSVIEPAYKPVSEGVQPRPEAPPIGEASVESTRTPPSGKELAKAEAHLTAYKRWLNQGFKAGLVSREECQVMTQDKEVKLGLRPPQ
jgi:hypothetical protein